MIKSPHFALLAEIESFLVQTGMGKSYFGKASTGNSELVSRLRAGKKIWPDTEIAVRKFMADRIRANTIANPTETPEPVDQTAQDAA